MPENVDFSKLSALSLMAIITIEEVIIVTVFNMIKERFGYDEPIFTSDIEAMFPDCSKAWINKEIKSMVNDKCLKRFSTGVYYIPKKTASGDSLLNPEKVITKKYIKNGSEIYGYVSDIALLNSLGLTRQVPDITIVVSNNVSSRGRMIETDYLCVYVVKSNIEITKENCAVLQLLEVLKLIDLDDLDEFKKHNLEKYIDDNGITIEMIGKYCSFFPDYVLKRILRGSMLGEFALK